MAAKNKNKGTKAKNQQVVADSEPVEVAPVESNVAASREKAKGKKSSGFMDYVRKSDPIIVTCCVVLILAFAIVIGAYVNANFISPEEDNRIAVVGDTVEVRYVGSYFAFYDEEGAVTFDTNIKSVAGSADYVKSPLFTSGNYSLLEFEVGGSSVLEMFGDAVIGKKVGDKVEVMIPYDKQYGTAIIQDFNTTVTIDMVNSMTLKEFNDFVDASYTADQLKEGKNVKTPLGLDAFASYNELSGLVNYGYNMPEDTTEKITLECDANVSYTIKSVDGAKFTIEYEFAENDALFLAVDNSGLIFVSETEDGYEYKPGSEDKSTNAEQKGYDLYFYIEVVSISDTVEETEE